MKQILTHIISFSLALIVLFSSFSFQVKEHYCEDELVSISLFGDKTSCDKEEKISCCEKKERTKNSNIDNESCCKEDVSFINTSIVVIVDNKTEVELTKEFIVSFEKINTSVKEILSENKNQFTVDFSPPIPNNLYLLYQSFLI